ncbi:MAG TPA: AAA family ATPase [Microthrixaceae bacterium]|nr:AAA family ATPase [Microthrixaceae bacterium]
MSDVADLIETHLSTVLFLGDRVVKIKKPIRTEFVDFTTLSARRQACHREVALNRRLAPDVYLGVADVTLSDQVVEHAVVMRRLPDVRRLSARLDRPDVDDDLRRIAHLLASFHASAERSRAIDAASGHDSVMRLWESGSRQIEPYVGPILDPDAVARMALLVREYLSGRRSLLDTRVSAGHACDGHGDLQADDIFMMDDGPRILDCLEFDDALRCGDVLADVAFLAMDLERLGHPGLADRFLDLYQEHSDDHWPESLAHLHVAYRAHIRSKVSCIRHDQGDPRAAATARTLHDQALSHLERARVQFVVVGGSPGTGKSSVATAIADRLSAVVLSSDQVRDDLVPRSQGRSYADGAHDGRYRPELVASVYRELLREAELLSGEGVSVVLDASWLDSGNREAARDLARRTSAHLTELRCVCPDDVAASRIRRRSAAGTDASEATVEIAAALRREATPWREAVEIRTDRDLDETVEIATGLVTST